MNVMFRGKAKYNVGDLVWVDVGSIAHKGKVLDVSMDGGKYIVLVDTHTVVTSAHRLTHRTKAAGITLKEGE